MTQPEPVTIAGRQVRVAPPTAADLAAACATGPGEVIWAMPGAIPTVLPPLPRPHRGRHHWVTLAVRHLNGAELPSGVDSTQLLQGCSRNCGQHRTRVIPGLWRARNLVWNYQPKVASR